MSEKKTCPIWLLCICQARVKAWMTDGSDARHALCVFRLSNQETSGGGGGGHWEEAMLPTSVALCWGQLCPPSSLCCLYLGPRSPSLLCRSGWHTLWWRCWTPGDTQTLIEDCPGSLQHWHTQWATDPKYPITVQLSIAWHHDKLPISGTGRSSFRKWHIMGLTQKYVLIQFATYPTRDIYSDAMLYFGLFHCWYCWVLLRGY